MAVRQVGAAASGDSDAVCFRDVKGAQARFNLGKSAPIITTASLTLDAKVGIDQQVYFNGAHTATLPTGVFAGWVTGEFHNLAGTSLGTVVPPSGVTLYNGGAAVASVSVAQGQEVKFVFDGTAWRATWRDRSPLLLAATYSGVASFDFAMPTGYQSLEIQTANFVPSVDNSELGVRLSADGGSTVRSGASDYLVSGISVTSSTAGGISSQARSYLYLSGQQTKTTYTTSRAALARASMDTKYGTLITASGTVNNTPNTAYGGILAAQAEGTALITPNLLRFIPSGGGTMSLNIWIRGVPSV